VGEEREKGRGIECEMGSDGLNGRMRIGMGLRGEVRGAAFDWDFAVWRGVFDIDIKR